MEFLSQYSGLIALTLLVAALLAFIRYYPEHEEEEEEAESTPAESERVVFRLNPDDEDATVACLVAAIECRNETHKNVQIVSVREVK